MKTSPSPPRTPELHLFGFLFVAVLLCCTSTAVADTRADPRAAEILTLQEALATGLERNLNLRLEAISIPLSEAAVTVEEAEFDLALEARASTAYQREPTASAFAGNRFSTRRVYSGEAGLLNTAPWGLSSRIGFETERLTDNSPITGLRPQYRSVLVLDLSQPLLRNFGREANTAGLRIARQRREQASFDFLSRALELGGAIENLYYELARAESVLEYRRQSLNLAEEILRHNRERLEAGLIPITEVQEAETAEAARREDLVLARQEMQTLANQLRDLLEIPERPPGGPVLFRVQPLTAPALRPPELSQALAAAFSHRPDLERERLEVRSRDINLAFRKNQTLPRLDLEASLGLNGLSGEEREVSFGRNFFEDEPPGPAFTGDYLHSVERMADGDGYQWSAGLLFSYPLGNRAAEALRRQAALERRQALHRLQRLEHGIITDVQNAMTEVQHSRERLELAARFEELAVISLEQEMERLRHGLSDTFRILDFQEGVITARIRGATALTSYHQGLTRLYQAMGLNLQRHNIVAQPNFQREVAE